MLRINRIIEKTDAEGPGTRFCIWVQGCHNHCEGCFATETWDAEKGVRIPKEDILSRILAHQSEIDGVTLLGGEPFEQAEALAWLAARVREAGLSVLCFTGRTHEWLLEQPDEAIHRLLAETDVLIDGAYRRDMQDFSRPLVGSKNQRFLFLSQRYSMQDIAKLKNRFELRVGRDGSVLVNGMGDIEKLKAFIRDYK